MYLEYDWTFNVYRPRFGEAFTSVNGKRSFKTLNAAKLNLERCGLELGPKTDTRTWLIESAYESA